MPGRIALVPESPPILPLTHEPHARGPVLDRVAGAMGCRTTPLGDVGRFATAELGAQVAGNRRNSWRSGGLAYAALAKRPPPGVGWPLDRTRTGRSPSSASSWMRRVVELPIGDRRAQPSINPDWPRAPSSIGSCARTSRRPSARRATGAKAAGFSPSSSGSSGVPDVRRARPGFCPRQVRELRLRATRPLFPQATRVLPRLWRAAHGGAGGAIRSPTPDLCCGRLRRPEATNFLDGRFVRPVYGLRRGPRGSGSGGHGEVRECEFCHLRPLIGTTPLTQDRLLTMLDIHAGACAQNTAGLDRRSHRIEPQAGWSKLVLPREQVVELRKLAARARAREGHR